MADRLALTGRLLRAAARLPRKIWPRRLPVVRQMEESDCGAACLSMVLGYFGRRVPLDELREATGAGRDGVSALAIVYAARAYGLRAAGVRADLAALRSLPRGSVLHWEFRHFVVLERARRGGARVVDPAHGRLFIPWSKFRTSYTGVAVAFEPAEGFVRGGSAGGGTWRYLGLILRQSGKLGRVVTTSLVIRLVALTLPLLTAMVVDEVLPQDDRHLLSVFATGAALVLGYAFLTSLLRSNLLLELSTRLDIGLTVGFVEHLVELPYAFFLRRSAGDLMMRMQSNTAVRQVLTSGTLSAVLDGVFAAFYLVLLFIVSPVLGWLVVVLAALQVTAMVLPWRRSQRMMAESLQAQADQQSYAYELLAGIETLKSCGAERQAADRWRRLFTSQVSIELSRGRLTSAANSVMSTLNLSSPLYILLVGATQVLAGHFSVGTMLSAAALASGFLGPLGTLVGTGLQLQVVTSYMARINDILDKPREQEDQQVQQASALTGRIRARNITFRYSTLAPDVVRNVSLDIYPGQRVGIAGRSGSGKSTLAHLLLGLYQPDSGRIELDGQDLAALDLKSVRRQLGIVTQHPYVFGSSIRENIALAAPKLPMQAIIEAAQLACIHDDIVAMPMGYDTLLHDGGASLSGGQRQRIALARALVSMPPILLLDEATSDLDAVTEQMVYENLAGISVTTIVIAHRLSTLRNADLIVVMEDGTIAEAGSPGELLSRRGAYWELVSAQSGAVPASSVPAPAGPAAASRSGPERPGEKGFTVGSETLL